jgi:hypothetical protein
LRFQESWKRRKSVTQGALRGCAAARPWALECNAFGVKIAALFDINAPLIPSLDRTREDGLFRFFETRSQLLVGMLDRKNAQPTESSKRRHANQNCDHLLCQLGIIRKLADQEWHGRDIFDLAQIAEDFLPAH